MFLTILYRYHSYDGKRISSYLIEELISSDESELALQLLLANPHLLAQHIDLAWKMALRTHHFNTAFAILTHPVANQSTLSNFLPNVHRTNALFLH